MDKWHVGLTVSGQGYSKHIQNQRGVVIASVGSHDIANSVSKMFQPTDRDEIDANACLIAAAPELLDALESLFALTNQANAGAFDNGVYDPTGTICEGEVIASQIMEEARIAIAKAKAARRGKRG